jgi:hypothetical protein
MSSAHSRGASAARKCQCARAACLASAPQSWMFNCAVHFWPPHSPQAAASGSLWGSGCIEFLSAPRSGMRKWHNKKGSAISALPLSRGGTSGGPDGRRIIANHIQRGSLLDSFFDRRRGVEHLSDISLGSSQELLGVVAPRHDAPGRAPKLAVQESIRA